MDGMLYDYQYCAASIAATLVIMTIFLMRKSYSTRSNHVFFYMLLDNLLASAVNIVTFFNISYPRLFPLWFGYIINQGYLFLYILMAALFLVYVSELTEVSHNSKFAHYTAAIIMSIEGILLLTTPFTHLIFYFDSELRYTHGPLHFILYVFALGMVSLGEVIFLKNNKKFNKYQIVAISSYIVVIFACVAFQQSFPYIAIGNLACGLLLFVLYNAFENPANYTFADTRCFNRNAFRTAIEEHRHGSSAYEIILIGIQDMDYLRHYIGEKGVAALAGRIAERLEQNFRKQAYHLRDDIYALIIQTAKDTGIDESGLNKKIEVCFAEPFHLEWTDMSVRYFTRIIPGEYVNRHLEYTEEALDFLMDNPRESDVDISVSMGMAIEKKKRYDEIVHILNRATAKDEFMVFYQPILNVKTGRYTSAEALIRLYDKELGYISPNEFIPIAEEQGKIIVIGDIVFRHICKFMNRVDLRTLGVNYIEVNLSPLQCAKSNLAESMLDIMDEYEIDPSWINLEITETAQMDADIERVMKDNVEQLRAKGVSFSIDDFGSGFASAQYLFKFPVSIVKIDKDILWQAMKNASAKVVMLAAMKMVNDLGKKVVVEGVENEEMAEMLRENGCDFMQGYLYSKPIPEDEYVRFLKKQVYP